MPDWAALGGNPVPGDPDAVRQLAGALGSFADDVELNNRMLRGVAEESLSSSLWIGPAAEAIRPKLADLPGKLDKLMTSHREASEALGTYWPRLEQAHGDALAALTKATEALRRHGVAQASLAAQQAANDRAASAALASGQPPPVPLGQHDFGTDVALADADLRAARHLAEQAAADRQRAARQAATALRQASEHGIHNRPHHFWDGVWDDVAKDFWKGVAFVANAAKAVAAAAGVVALVAALIPLPGFQVVAAFAESVALISSGVALVADLTLVAGHRGSLKDVGLDALGFALAGASGVLSGAGDAAATFAEGSDMVAKGSQLMESGTRLATEGSRVIGEGADLTAAGGDLVAQGAVEVGDHAAAALTESGLKLAGEGAGRTGAGVKLVADGATQLEEGTRLTSQGARDVAEGSDTFGGQLASGAQRTWREAAQQATHPLQYAEGARAEVAFPIADRGAAGAVWKMAGLGGKTVTTVHDALDMPENVQHTVEALTGKAAG